MKSLFKHSVLILTALFMMGCANSNSQPASSNAPISSSIKDDSVSYDAFKTEVDKFGDITYTKAVFKYEITEKIEGNPLEASGSSETGTVTSVLEFERTPDGYNKVTNDTTKTTESKKLVDGYPNDIKGWFKWITLRKNEAEKSNNLTYSDKFYLNPLKASYSISSDRLATSTNATFEGTYQGTSISALTFNEKGLVVKIEEEVKTDIDGTVNSRIDGPYQAKGHYERVAVATITYVE
jgi:hypothetical protein